MSDIVCVLSERTGKVLLAQKGDFSLQKGDAVIIESELGGELAVVKNVADKICESYYCRSYRSSGFYYM